MIGIKPLQAQQSSLNALRLPLSILSALLLTACGGVIGNSADVNDAVDSGDTVVVVPTQESTDVDQVTDSTLDDDAISTDEMIEVGDGSSLIADEIVTNEADEALDSEVDTVDVNDLEDSNVTDQNELVDVSGSDDVDENGLEALDTIADADADADADEVGDDSENEETDVAVVALPTSFTNVAATAGAGITNTESVRVQETLGVSSPFVSEVFGFSSSDNSTVLGVQQFTVNTSNGVSTTNVDHYAVDVNSLSIDALFQTDVASSGALSADFSELALSENCQAFTRRIGSGSAGTVVNQLTLANVCFTQASISDNGETAVFIASPSAVSENGTTIAGEGLNSQSGPIILHRPSGVVTSLTLDNIVIPGTLTNIYNFSFASDIDISADGSTVVARLQFIPNVQNALALVEVLSLIVIVDAASGEYSAIDQQFTRQFVCANCATTSAYDVEISDDGQRLLFLRPSDDQITQVNAESTLFVYNRATDETVALDIDDGVTAGTLTVDGAAARAAFVNTAGAPVLINLESGERIDMDAAIRGCSAIDLEDCAFDSYQLSAERPLILNTNGNVLSMILTPESSLPISEAFLLDTETLEVERLAPNRQVNQAVADAAGDHIAYSGVSSNDQQSEIFLIRR